VPLTAIRLKGASDRARAIVTGLVLTHRGSDPRVAGAFVRLRAAIGGFHWVRIDGAGLLRGDDVDVAEHLQETFTETMARAGERAKTMPLHAACSNSSSTVACASKLAATGRIARRWRGRS
jgi:hypothetical protein